MIKIFDIFVTSIVEILTKIGCSKDTITWIVIIVTVCMGVFIVFIPVHIFNRYINQSPPKQTLPTKDSEESIALGMRLFFEIEEYRRGYDDLWSWETFVSEEDFNCNGRFDPDLVCRIAGCWYRSTEDGRLRLYCNQNHSSHGGRP